tara:strand:- start:7 stop:555 length:549 start_codon:yes stop_codon:yes gene_type:complete
MAIKTEDFDIDPLARAIPGQSFTDTPGKHPYENPAMVSSPEEALEAVEESLNQPTAVKSIINLLDAGISSETIASSVVLKMFSEGVFSPDVAEIIKPPLVAIITDMGTGAGIEDINVINEIPQDGMGEADSLALMSQVNPEKYNRQMAEFSKEEEDMEFASQVELPPEDIPKSESFLDMEVE